MQLFDSVNSKFFPWRLIMRALAKDKFSRDNSFSFTDSQVVNSVRFSFTTGLACGIIVALAFCEFIR